MGLVFRFRRRLDQRRNDGRRVRRRAEEVTRRRQLERRRELVGSVERDDDATSGALFNRPVQKRNCFESASVRPDCAIFPSSWQ